MFYNALLEYRIRNIATSTIILLYAICQGAQSIKLILLVFEHLPQVVHLLLHMYFHLSSPSITRFPEETRLPLLCPGGFPSGLLPEGS